MSPGEPSPAPRPDDPAGDDRVRLAQLAATRERLVEQIERRVVGQREVVELLLTALFAGGHALFVGVPGLAKTLLVGSLAEATQLEFSRIQFTPDLMPTDITGTDVLEEDPASGKRSFRFIAGPVFANLLLADEINRTPPKTQAALLQAMQEGRITAGGRTHPLPVPFQVFATQNPIEQEGTYPLPEAQLDRFMLQIEVRYPAEEDERRVVAMGPAKPAALQPVISPAELLSWQTFVRAVPAPPNVVSFVVDLLRRTRPGDDRASASIRELVRWGAGPRAGQLLLLAAQARAALAGDPAVTVEHIRALAIPALAHRVVPSFAADSRGVSAREILGQVLAAM